MLGVILSLSKNNSFSDQRTGFVFDAVVNQVFKNDAVGVFTEDLAANIFTSNGGVFSLFFSEIFFQLALLFITQILVMNSIAEEVGGEIFYPKRCEIWRLIVDSRIQTKLECWVSGFTI